MLKDRRCNLVIKIQRALNPAVFSHFPKALLGSWFGGSNLKSYGNCVVLTQDFHT